MREADSKAIPECCHLQAIVTVMAVTRLGRGLAWPGVHKVPLLTAYRVAG